MNGRGLPGRNLLGPWRRLRTAGISKCINLASEDILASPQSAWLLQVAGSTPARHLLPQPPPEHPPTVAAANSCHQQPTPPALQFLDQGSREVHQPPSGISKGTSPIAWINDASMATASGAKLHGISKATSTSSYMSGI